MDRKDWISTDVAAKENLKHRSFVVTLLTTLMSYPQETFLQTRLKPGTLLSNRREVVSANTLIYQLEVLKKTGRYDAFKLEWHSTYSDPPMVWPIPNHLFWDSDVAKWIEGACYLLHGQSHSQINVAVQDLVDMIRSAQQPDGYINIHYTVVEPGKRFTNLRDFHELYNAGHLIEAALAHNQLYRNDQLLGPILRYVDLLCDTFGPKEGQLHGYPGHPEIELALLRLYRRTQNLKHLALAEYFVTERGNPSGSDGKHFYIKEAEKRGDDPQKRPEYYPELECLWYYQAHSPLVQQQTIEGHSVRATYLLTAAADLVSIKLQSRSELKKAVLRLWKNMVYSKMYVTGGIGAIKQYEGFGLDYFLPQGTDEGGCYAETCAAIGVMMLAQRILQFDLNRKYADVMELCLYNSMLTAMSHDGQKFTYVNQLASSDQDLSKREEWFTCACCPPNVLRLLGQIGGYIYNESLASEENGLTIDVHLYISSSYDFSIGDAKGTLKQESNWPWSGNIDFSITSQLARNVTLRLRIPAWAPSWEIKPRISYTTVENGYLIIPAEWLAQNSSFTLSIPLKPRLITPHPYTNQNTLTLARGPIIYCVEDYDNRWVEDHFKSVQLDPDCNMTERMVSDSATEEEYVAVTVRKGAFILNVDALEASPGVEIKDLAHQQNLVKVIDDLHFIPYYFRANRGGRGHMRVGLKRWIK